MTQQMKDKNANNGPNESQITPQNPGKNFAQVVLELAERMTLPFRLRVVSFFDDLVRQQFNTDNQALERLRSRILAEEMESNQLSKSTSIIEMILKDVPLMSQHYSDYSPDTARHILNKLDEAYLKWSNEGGQWGPGFVARVTKMNAATVSRYFRAFHAVGIKEYRGVPIPYRSQIKSKKHQ